MNIKVVRRTIALSLALAIASSAVFPAGGAHAAPSQEEPIDSEATELFDMAVSAAPDLIQDPASGTMNLGDGTLTVSESVITYVDENPTSPIELADNSGAAVLIELPLTDELGDGAVTEEGATVYAGDDTSLVVIPTDAGVQTIISISEPTAPTEYSFPLTIPSQATLSSNEDGSVSLIDPAGETIGGFEAPWAVDASGRSVPTSYRIDGHTLVQQIDYTSGDYQLPITADPSWWWWAGTTALCVAEVAGLLVAGAKTLATFSTKINKIVQSSRAAINSWKVIGSAKNFANLVKTYVKAKSTLTPAQLTALNTLFSKVGDSIMTLLGFGSCWAIVQELRK